MGSEVSRLAQIIGDPARREALQRRFWNKVDRRGPDECWPWGLKSRTGDGYGRVSVACVSQPSHRVAWTLSNGSIPVGFVVRHACDNAPCCNPAHLILGTVSDNVRDMKERGRCGVRSSQRAMAVRLANRRGGRSSANGQVMPQQLAAARALVKWSQKDLAERCGGVCHLNTIKRYESGRSDAKGSTLLAWRRALSRAGVTFIDGSDTEGPGVRLREPMR